MVQIYLQISCTSKRLSLDLFMVDHCIEHRSSNFLDQIYCAANSTSTYLAILSNDLFVVFYPTDIQFWTFYAKPVPLQQSPVRFGVNKNFLSSCHKKGKKIS